METIERRLGALAEDVCGWRAKHAVSLEHGVASLLGVRAGAEASPRLAFLVHQNYEQVNYGTPKIARPAGNRPRPRRYNQTA
jgi:hypothetical protein